MTLNEKITRAVIESIHGLPYRDCVYNEWIADKQNIGFAFDVNDEEHTDTVINILEMNHSPRITIGRVMQALIERHGEWNFCSYTSDKICIENGIFWKLTKENGQECTIEDQSEKTKEKLLELLNQ